MYLSSHDTYLETQINTATPQKLRLMLIEGAQRFARLARTAWEAGDQEAGLEALIRCREIVGELLAGVQADSTPLTRQVSGLYGYLFTELTAAQLTRDSQALESILRILDEERETWQQVCLQMPDRPTAPTGPHFAAREELAPATVSRANSFSLDA